MVPYTALGASAVLMPGPDLSGPALADLIVGKELDVIAAVVLGGASLAGGVGTVGGTLLGVFLIAIVKNGMTLVKIPAVWYDVFIGIVILVSVSFSSWQRKKEHRQSNIEVSETEVAS